ncbi:MAG: hypothetical protein ACYCZX_12230 [Rhodospirillaceae bacterium]
MYMTVEKLPGGAEAAGLAAFDLVQKLFLLLIERRALTTEEAQIILRDSIETQEHVMDTEWAPVNVAAASLLRKFSEAITKQHGGQGLPD